MATQTIDYEQFIHPNDRKGLAMVKAVPGLDVVCKKCMEIGIEKIMRNLIMASAVRLGPNQMPQIYDMLVEVCDKLGIDVPELYLQSGPINAYTLGETHPQIVLCSGLLVVMDEDELKSVIAHECGHILCHHVLYENVFRLLVRGGSLFTDLVKDAAYYPMLYWKRCAEYSADRVAAYVMDDGDVVARMIVKLVSGFIGRSWNLDYKEFLRQADTVEELEEQSWINKGINFYLEKDMSHPFYVRRAREVKEWYDQSCFELPPPANGGDAKPDLSWGK